MKGFVLKVRDLKSYVMFSFPYVDSDLGRVDTLFEKLRPET